MDKESITNSNENSYDVNNSSIRPKGFNDFIGQENIKSKLKVFIDSAKKRDVSLDHILFYGPPGLGKTTLAQIIAEELGSNIKATSAPVIERPGDLASILTTLGEKDILFIDEIHRLRTVVEEVLYSAMEDFFVDIKVGEGTSAKSFRVKLPKFTLIGATTRSGLLSTPLYDRFGIVERLEFYTNEDLADIVKRSSKFLNIDITDSAAISIASRSRGTPRIVNRLLRRVFDFATVSDVLVIDEKFASDSLEKLGVDKNGFEALDKQYLNTIIKNYNGGPVGVDTISVSLSEQIETIEDVIEPYLIQSGFIKRTPKGRVATIKAYSYLNINVKNNDNYKENTLFDL
ncbi:Holliday junction branch migration DNA helicase RuvB [Brachyspira pilosicoli]|uniref:Holliday junction branch migration complex subunit RuvB n=1 Tax=Brachyspira pilosicoli TaxID=52584 RepID=A0A5C8EIE7_BRAPL|nr:Holliday junction branch migration DNA helicase RuvB [Brachyspira pilosicoli]TXJ37208.1 Holliday junction branch migration DNA helicase RuvB [Brachyspira pilosicoli]